MSVLTSLPEWKKLSELAATVKDAHMRDWFAQDANRADKMQLKPAVFFLITRKTV